jgi:hypothetical protein
VPLSHPEHPEIPNSVDDVIQLATAKAPDDRYGSVLDLVAKWHDAVGGEGDPTAA